MAKNKEKLTKFWNFGTAPDGTPELTIYGIIASEEWWGDEVTHTQFYKDLQEIGTVAAITVRINSGGGDVFAAFAIYNLLRENAAQINVIIDGWAASAATIIAMAGDTIKIPKTALFMVHDPALRLWGSYTAEEFTKMADQLEKVKSAIMSAYCDRTGKTEDEISALMDAETYLTGEQAVEMGFCDELLYSDVAISTTNANHVIVNSVDVDLTAFKSFPKGLLPVPSHTNAGNNITSKKNEDKQGKEVKNMEIKTVDALRAAYPDLVTDIENTAVMNERERIKAIEDMAPGGFENMVQAAKFEKPVTAEALAVQILAEQKEQGGNYLAERKADVTDSGAAGVPSTGVENLGGEDGDAVINSAIDRVFGKEEK